jgi:hypothetical protein
MKQKFPEKSGEFFVEENIEFKKPVANTVSYEKH